MSSAMSQYTTADLAGRVHGELSGRADLSIVGVNALDDASAQEITFIADEIHARRWGEVEACAAVISAGIEPKGHDPRSRALIIVPDAAMAMVDLLTLFAPPDPLPALGVHPTAVVHETATLGRDVRIGPHVSVDAAVRLGDRVVVHAGARLYAHVQIGDDSIVHANAVIRQRCRIGRRVVLHQNSSIGADGFGFETTADGSGLVKVPQIGTVRIEDDVEIGAGACIDRAKFGETLIGADTKIDNLVQIGHNCHIGRGCVIAAHTGISGSVTVGNGVRMAGAVGIIDHITIGDGATIGAQAGVMKDVAPGRTVVGAPADEVRRTMRRVAAFRKLPDWMQQVSKALKQRDRKP